MNAQIRKIAKESGLSISQAYSAEFNKFAELIIEECADLLDEELTLQKMEKGVVPGDLLKRHFGVE